MKKSILNEIDKENIRTMLQEKHSINEICVSLKLFRKPVEEFLLSEGLIDTSVSKYFKTETTFSEELQNVKESSGMTNTQLADFLCVPLRTFEDWKAGRRTPAEYVQKAILEGIKNLKG